MGDDQSGSDSASGRKPDMIRSTVHVLGDPSSTSGRGGQDSKNAPTIAEMIPIDPATGRPGMAEGLKTAVMPTIIVAPPLVPDEPEFATAPQPDVPMGTGLVPTPAPPGERGGPGEKKAADAVEKPASEYPIGAVPGTGGAVMKTREGGIPTGENVRGSIFTRAHPGVAPARPFQSPPLQSPRWSFSIRGRPFDFRLLIAIVMFLVVIAHLLLPLLFSRS